MDFSNTLPDNDDKSAPHIFSGPHDPPPPSYTASGADAPHCVNVRWTPARCARYDYILHIISLILGTFTLTAYVFDLAKSASYHVKLPVGLTVVDVLSIVFLIINNGWSVVYFVSGIYTRMSQGKMGRKWPTILDLVLHCCLVGIADTTLSMRSGGGSCDRNRAVGGCLASRRALMIATGVVMILVGVTVQVRFAVSMHARSESKKLAKAARREAVQGEAGITWSNNIR